MTMMIVVLLCSLVVTVTSAPLLSRSPSSSVTLLPTQDDFYSPPSGFESSSPGTILKSRVLPKNSIFAASLSPQHLENVYQFLYRTNDALGQPVATVTTLLAPYYADRSKLVSYQIAADSANVDCFPSYTLRQSIKLLPLPSLSDLTGLFEQDTLFMDALLGHGYFVVTPDFEGPLGLVFVKDMVAHGVLDSVRAVLSSGYMDEGASVQLWGYSGGAFATGAAAEEAPKYAPELNLVGAVLGGTPIDFFATYARNNGGPFSGYNALPYISLARQYTEAKDYMDQVFRPEKKQAFWDMGALCVSEVITHFAFQRMEDYLVRSDALLDPIIVNRINGNLIGQTNTAATPQVPVLLYHAMLDEIVPFAPAQDLYSTWCSQDATVEFVKGEIGEHVSMQGTSAAHALRFIMDRFNGVAISGCNTKIELSSTLDVKDLSLFGKLVYDRLTALLGQRIGPHPLLL